MQLMGWKEARYQKTKFCREDHPGRFYGVNRVQEANIGFIEKVISAFQMIKILVQIQDIYYQEQTQ